MGLGETIAKLRKERGWSQPELAALVGMHQAHITRIERGRAKPRMKTLAKLAEVFDLRPEDLLRTEAASEPALPGLEDQELRALLSRIPSLRQAQREALKTVLRDMLTLTTLEAALLHHQQAS